MSNPRADAERPPLWPTIAAGALLFAAVVAAFFPALRGGFIWDDDAHVTANACIVGPLGFKQIWTTAAAEYFPLVLSTFWLEHAIWGLNPLPYHALSLLCHGGSALLLWRVLLKLGVPGAWLGAALWAIHPVQVESVAWISETKNTESGIFYLLTILLFLRWLDAGGSTRGGRSWAGYGAALLCALLAMLSKPSTVVLPAVLALCWWWSATSGRAGSVVPQLGWRRIRALLPFAAISLAASAWAIWEQTYHSWARGAEWNQSQGARLVIAGRDIWFYLEKLAWPHPVMFVYPRWTIDAAQFRSWIPLAAAVGAGGWLWFHRRERGRPGFIAGSYFVLTLGPVLGFFNVFFFRYSFVSDHFQYLASMGPLALAAAGIVRCARWLPGPGAIWAALFAGALALAWGVPSWSECGGYHDSETLWRTAARRNAQSGPVQNNLGVAVAMQGGRLAEATAHFETAVRLAPDFSEGHFNLGIARAQSGRLPEAIEQYETALRLNPNYPEAEYDLGYALLMSRRGSEATAHFRAALRIWPSYAAAREMLDQLQNSP